MTRLANALLQSGQSYGNGKNAPMVDLLTGGQMGISENLAEWVSNTAYPRKNVICLVVEAPKGFSYMKNPEHWTGTLRALAELHALSIDGLNMGYEVETSESPVGGSGQVQEDPTNVKETQSSITFKWAEKYGMPVANFFKGWISGLIQNPHTKVPDIATITGQKPTDMLADMYSATMIFIEPDPLHNKVVKAWLVTNMFPKGTGDISGRRDVTQGIEQVTYDIPFSGIVQTGVGVDTFAQTLLNGISMVGANPYNRQAFVQAISADVAAVGKGFAAGVNDLASQAVLRV